MSALKTVFVYGTLKRGQCRNHVLREQTFQGVAQTAPEYVLVNLGDYPGLVLPTAFPNSAIVGRSIEGELYNVDADCLKALDQIECIEEGLYSRAPVKLLTPRVDAIAYFYERAVDVSQIMGDRW